MRQPKSWTASSQDEEADLIEESWNDIQKLARHEGDVRWVTCNGRRFDVHFLSARSVRHGISPTNQGIMNTHKYRTDDHLDLANLWDAPWYSLADLCDHLGVESPKGEFDGSDVAPAVRDGKIQKVRRYCEGDAVATFKCAQLVQDAV